MPRHRTCLETIGYFFLSLLKNLGIDFVALCQHNNPCRNSKHFNNAEMFLCLWFPSFIGINDQHHDVDSTNARNHGANKVGMPRDIDKTQHGAVTSGAVCKAEINGHCTALFFCQSVRVCARDCTNQRRLAVVNMAGCGDNRHGLPQ